MKYRHPLLLSLLALLCSCQGPAGSGVTSDSSTPSEPEPSLSSSEESSSSESSSTEESFSSSETSSKETVDGVYQFYCVNDFHGSVNEQYNGNYYEAGISKLFGKLKEYKAKDPEHTFIFSAGDMYQGSLESNDNYGRLVTECMNATGFDAMALGNHEFDYGQNHLLDLVSWSEFPILAGNVFTYDKGATTEPWHDGIFPSSTTIERGGNKIGVVGMIGYGQTSSITSNYVQDIYFANPYRLATAEATRLREEEGCDMVIYLLHDDMSSCRDYATKEYFDGVFTGHRHTRNNGFYGGVPFMQSYCNGEAISHFELTIKDGEVTCTNHENIWAKENWAEDEEIAQIRDSFLENPDFRTKADAVAGTITGTLAAKEGVSNIVAKSIYEKYRLIHPEIVGAMQNGLRAPLSGTVTYRDIYKAAPFMNHVVIALIPGSEILRQAEENSFYRDDHDTFEANELYSIACVDYVLYHQNDQKRYNYFPSLNDHEERILHDYEDYPFDIVFDYMVNDLGGVIDADDYRNTSPGFGA